MISATRTEVLETSCVFTLVSCKKIDKVLNGIPQGSWPLSFGTSIDEDNNTEEESYTTSEKKIICGVDGGCGCHDGSCQVDGILSLVVILTAQAR